MHTLALISNMMSKCLNLDSLKCSLISVILLCVQFGVVDYDPGTRDQKTKSLHFFADNKITKIVEFIGKTSTILAKILNWLQNVVFIARVVIIQIKAIVK